MMLENVLNIVVVCGWLLLLGFIFRFLVYRTKYDGFWTAVKKLTGILPIYLILLAVLGLSALSNSLVFILPNEVAVVVSLISTNGYRPSPLRSGLHWIVPLAEEVHRMPIYWQTYTMSGKPSEGAQTGDDSITARTSDGQEVTIDATIIFRINPEDAPRIFIEWQDRYISDLIRPTLRGLIRTYVSQYKVDEVNSSKRMDLENDLTRELNLILTGKGFSMDSFLVRNITFSDEYSASVERKQVAFQDSIMKQYEAEQLSNLAEGEANRTILLAKAEAEAIRILGEALNSNPQVVTLRYVDKLSPAIQVMLVPNDNPYMLPLPSLAGLPTPTASPLPTATATPTPTTGP